MPEKRKPAGGGGHAGKDVVQRATSEQILGRPLDAIGIEASRGPVALAVPTRWKKYYRRLLEIRDETIDEETRLKSESANTGRDFVTDSGAESANAAFEQDKALGRLSAYQERLDEVNQALSRIENGTYGVCELTGKRIAPERLEAVPWTRFSLEAEREIEARGEAPVHFEIPPQFSVRDVSLGKTEAARGSRRQRSGDQRTRGSRNKDMPAKSKKQQMAAGAALAAKRGEKKKSSLKGASKSMAKSMSKKELEKMASAKRKNLPKRAGSGKKSGSKSKGSKKK